MFDRLSCLKRGFFLFDVSFSDKDLSTMVTGDGEQPLQSYDNEITSNEKV